MNLEEAKAIFSAFERENVRYVLIGSMAMAAQGLVRATQDVDFFVASDPENVGAIKRALHGIFDDPSIDEIGTNDLAAEYPVIRYAPPDVDFVIDLVAGLGDAFVFDDIEWEPLVLDGITVRVASPRMLYRMKRDTVRPQDRVDAEKLRSRFGLEEE